jgi:hypothetical protein
MAETLLTPSSIKLYGRVMNGISLDPSSLSQQAGNLGANKFLRNQLTNNTPQTFIVTGVTNNGSPTVIVGVGNMEPELLYSLVVSNANIPISDQTGGTTIPANTTVQAVAIDYTNSTNGIPSGIKLTLSADAIADNPKGVNLVLQVSFPPTIARIYSFSFEGAYYQLPRPALFLVHGLGTPVGNWVVPSTMDQGGVVGREWDFSGNAFPTDLVYWEYEKGDFSLRLDLDAGPFEQILLQMALRSGAGVSGAGVSGAGVSGAGVSGAGVSGAGVSGAGVSGAGVSGAGVSGAGVRR